MKKLFLAIVCLACSLTISAQSASSSSTSFFSSEKSDAPITFGIRGGVNFSKVTATSEGYSVSAKNNTGFNVGVSMDVPMLESLYFQTGMYFVQKGFKDGDTTSKPDYLEMPLYMSYRYNFASSVQLQVNFGPYLAYGIAGKTSADNTDYDCFGDNGGYKNFDCGLGFGAGLTVNKIFFGINYDLGLTNVSKASSDYGSLKNRSLSLNVGFNF
jgi:hypothetical protein